MPGFTHKSVEDYINNLLPPRDRVLASMEELAKKDGVPIVGPAIGRLLYQLAKMVDARRIFELGSAIGYSTIWWARALPPDGKVYYTDGSRANAQKAERYIRDAGLIDRVEILIGDALESFDRVEGEFDIVFNDVDKHDYPRVFEKAAGRVRIGGLLVADNVLWSARVADVSVNDENTAAIRRFNEMLMSDPRYDSSIIPMRDGIGIGRRIR